MIFGTEGLRNITQSVDPTFAQLSANAECVGHALHQCCPDITCRLGIYGEAIMVSCFWKAPSRGLQGPQ